MKTEPLFGSTFRVKNETKDKDWPDKTLNALYKAARPGAIRIEGDEAKVTVEDSLDKSVSEKLKEAGVEFDILYSSRLRKIIAGLIPIFTFIGVLLMGKGLGKSLINLLKGKE